MLQFKFRVQTSVCVLGAYGGHIGLYIARECLTRGLPTRILVREGWADVPEKKARVDELVSLGAVLVPGDASDLESLLRAFEGVGVVISALGGWAPLGPPHDNVYAACKACGVGRVVPAQFGIDVLSFEVRY